jgi:hypothetical protein
MDFSSTFVPLISNAYEELFKQAAAIEHRLEYRASRTCRSPKELLLECVSLPTYATLALNSRELPPLDQFNWAYKGFDSIESSQADWKAVKPDLFKAIEGFPSEKLVEEVKTPWGTFPWRDFIAFCYWNPMWHAGQMAYIQMIHGDEKMH